VRKRYPDWESAFEFVWNHADGDGLWAGSAASLAAEFSLAEDEAHAMLGKLCDRGLVQRLGPAQYCITKWPERDQCPEVEEHHS
jgi:hypothetical protein